MKEMSNPTKDALLVGGTSAISGAATALTSIYTGSVAATLMVPVGASCLIGWGIYCLASCAQVEEELQREEQRAAIGQAPLPSAPPSYYSINP